MIICVCFWLFYLCKRKGILDYASEICTFKSNKITNIIYIMLNLFVNLVIFNIRKIINKYQKSEIIY